MWTKLKFLHLQFYSNKSYGKRLKVFANNLIYELRCYDKAWREYFSSRSQPAYLKIALLE